MYGKTSIFSKDVDMFIFGQVSVRSAGLQVNAHETKYVILYIFIRNQEKIIILKQPVNSSKICKVQRASLEMAVTNQNYEEIKNRLNSGNASWNLFQNLLCCHLLFKYVKIKYTKL
jgi:hypothetical protein